jgi:hypothetical protein
MTTFGCGRYSPTKALIFFTLKWVEGELTPINRHVRGIVWLAWKFLWQQLAEIERGSMGRFDPLKALKGIISMHHTAVLGSLYDYQLVRQDKLTGARKKNSPEQEEAETYRVWPFVTISRSPYKLTYTTAYYRILADYGITPAEGIAAPE